MNKIDYDLSELDLIDVFKVNYWLELNSGGCWPGFYIDAGRFLNDWESECLFCRYTPIPHGVSTLPEGKLNSKDLESRFA